MQKKVCLYLALAVFISVFMLVFCGSSFAQRRLLFCVKSVVTSEFIWNQFGWPDFCRPVGDGDFECE